MLFFLFLYCLHIEEANTTMKQIVLQVPDKQYPFFMELMAKLDFTITESEGSVDIPDFHKTIVLARLSELKPENLINWEDAQKRLDVKYGA